jgi:dihydrofolate reductase
MNQRRLVLFLHTSLDGFVNGPNGEFDWIAISDDLFAYAGERTKHSDLALYGRKTFEMMEGYWPTAAQQPNATPHDIEHGAWYNQVRKVVVSKSWKGKQLPNTTIVSDNLKESITRLKAEGGKEIIMFGSPGAGHSLMAEGLIDDLWLFVNPVLLGGGTPVFKDIKAITKLKLEKSHTFPSGVVCLHYSKI